MKYLNQLNILLAGASLIVVGFAMSKTIWAPEREPQINITSVSSEPRGSARQPGSLSPTPERRNMGGRRVSAPAVSPRDPIQAAAQGAAPGFVAEESNPADPEGGMAPAASASPAEKAPPNSQPTRVISTSGAPTDTGRAAENSPPERPSPRVVRKNRLASPPRPVSRPPAGRPGFSGGTKRDRQDGPASPPVRSSFPSQRLP